MRTSLIMTAVILSVTAAAAQDRPAGERRPRLQVLRDVPESQLFMVMNVVAQSLGVGCEHCHVRNTPEVRVSGGWEWDRDDKPAKSIGRDMMRMVRELNTSRFGGRLVVTCFTCHRGNIRVPNLPPLPPAEPAAPALALPSAAEVIAKYTAAVGGANASTRFATLVMEGRDVRPESRYEPDVGRSGTFRIVFKGDRFRTDFAVPPQPASAQVVVGSAGWASRGDAVLRALPADALGRVRRTATRYAPLKVAEPVSALRVDRMERIGGRDAYVLSTDLDDGTKRSYFFDAFSGLLVREITTVPTTFVPFQEQLEYYDYRPVDGIMLPFMVRFSNDAAYETSTRTFTSIRHDVPVDDAIFAVPLEKQR